MTPNVVEYDRLQNAFETEEDYDLSNAMFVRKGKVDLISRGGRNDLMQCEEEGGLKRSGGIGDILAGSLGTLFAWNVIYSSTSSRAVLVASTAVHVRFCSLATCVVRPS